MADKDKLDKVTDAGVTLEFDAEKTAAQVKDAVEKKLKAPWFWIKNSDGRKSASLTFAVVAFLVCTLWVMASIFVSIGPVQIRVFDPAVAGVYLGPIVALYWGRRNTESQEKLKLK